MKTSLAKKKVYVSGAPDFMKYYSNLTNQPLKKHIDNAMDVLKSKPNAGNSIQRNHWPEKYIVEHDITNLFRYQLPDGYRLVYTIMSEDNEITCVLLEVFNHTEYERRFGYS